MGVKQRRKRNGGERGLNSLAASDPEELAAILPYLQ